MELFEKISAFSDKNGISRLITDAGCVVCAYSGGADSTLLLRFLDGFCKKHGVRLVAAHMNHMIRGAESDRDENFCRDACHDAGIEFVVQHADIPALCARRKLGCEECAREERYRFLGELSEKYGRCPVATAHNATDNLETVLFSLARGTGARGLCGIPPVRDGLYVRPLLCCTSEEIRGFDSENLIPFVYDSTNSDNGITRNYIRSTLVPALRRLNPAADTAAARMSGILREDCDFIEGEARALLARGRVFRTEAESAHPAVFARLVSLMFSDCTGTLTNLSEANISDCAAIVHSGGTGSVSLPSGAKFFAKRDEIFVSYPGKRDPLPEKITLRAGETALFGKYYVAILQNEADIPSPDENIYNLSIHTAVDFDKIYGNLFIRTRLPGDVLASGGMHKKLKKLMCDKGVPGEERDYLPIFCDDDGILWVPGVGARDGAKPCGDTKSRAYLCVFGSSDEE